MISWAVAFVLLVPWGIGYAQSRESVDEQPLPGFGHSPPSGSRPRLPSKATERNASKGRPGVALPEKPKGPTPENVEAGSTFWERQHLLDGWLEFRPELENRGIRFDADLYWGVSSALSDRNRLPNVLSRDLVNFDTTVDFEKLGLWQGGTGFISVQQQAGRHSQAYFGDFQGISNIDSADRTQIAQAWFEQILWQGELRIKVGKVDANSEFAYVEQASVFLNSSFGVSPTIFALPTYPDPATSINVFWQPHEVFTWEVGLYDGEGISGTPTGSRFFRTRFAGGSNLFTISEATFRWNFDQRLPGRLGLGSWFHNGDFRRFDGSIDTGTGGVYLVLDQLLWVENSGLQDDQGIGISLQWGLSDPRVSEARQHFGIAGSWTGAIPHRNTDVLGLGVSVVELSQSPGTSFAQQQETVIEALYQISVTPFWSISCDLQTVIHPGGSNRSPLAVATLRNVIHF